MYSSFLIRSHAKLAIGYQMKRLVKFFSNKIGNLMIVLLLSDFSFIKDKKLANSLRLDMAVLE